jgi:hypothetical protein
MLNVLAVPMLKDLIAASFDWLVIVVSCVLSDMSHDNYRYRIIETTGGVETTSPRGSSSYCLLSCLARKTQDMYIE